MHSFKTHINNPKKHVKYIGAMNMSKHGRLELFNLLHDLDKYPADSTLTRQTLETLGITLPPSEKLVVGKQY